MWCDNCLLLFPLRAGAIAWAVVVALYSLAGALFLLMYGQYLFFVYPEWFIYGGIGMAVCAAACINAITLSNRSYVWARVCNFLWPFIIVICGVRAVFMIWELHRGKDKIIWECQNGGQQWGQPAENSNTFKFPEGICGPGWQSLFTAFIVSLLVDLGFQMYMFFLNWRFMKKLQRYTSMKGPYGNYYHA
ncbi:hypothetical protein PIIN_03740 [Serendipita indica DSM 11827]|uniref:Uncharacterized protein n=1 Tax=Serendipita indica (strain DSM 11827) TaxID=1109443 RepID=G4TEQ2_SERID|nr:hypothetical protein PIIN_03740 [Serendipita indica DSM 11827]